ERIAYDQSMAQRREAVADRRHLARIKTRSGDERGTCADGDARRNGLRAERGEQRRNHATALERAEDCDIELGNAAAQDEHALARGYAEIRQYVSEAAGFAIQLRIGEFARSAGSAEPADR